MTTLLTITTAVLAVCAVALGWRCRRLRKELSEANEKAPIYADKAFRMYRDKYQEYVSKLEKQNADQMAAMGADTCTYVLLVGADGRAEVHKCVENIGDQEYILIKRFTDEDASFNQREAEELLDKLNEK